MFESIDKKKLIIIGCSIIGFVVVILLASFVISIVKPHYYSYEEVEEKIKSAVKSYYESNPSMVPVNDGEYTVQYSTLEEGKFIKPLNEILKDGDNCSVNITVSKSGDNISYLPYLTCPGSYETKELYKVIKENNPTVSEGSGLYENENGGYYFRGEVKNNYVTFGTIDVNDTDYPYLWRILSIESDNTIKLMATLTDSDFHVWDDRYNEGKESDWGYNTFELSRAKETLKNLENNTNIANDLMKNALVSKELCVGKRKVNDTTKDGSVECSIMSTDKFMFGLITPYEYMRASLDENCKTLDSESCSNYNFLYSRKNNTWTLTAEDSEDNDFNVYYLYKYAFKSSRAALDKPFMPTAYLNSRALFKSGNGTSDDPYVIR